MPASPATSMYPPSVDDSPKSREAPYESARASYVVLLTGLRPYIGLLRAGAGPAEGCTSYIGLLNAGAVEAALGRNTGGVSYT